MKQKILRKVIVTISILTLIMGTLTGCGEGNTSDASGNIGTAVAEEEDEGISEDIENADDEVIKLGLLGGHVLPVVASKNGYFEEQGINVELVSFATGAAEIEAYTSGELDIIQCGDLPLLNGLSNGLDLQVIGTYSVSDTTNGLVVRDDADISDFSDLKGKVVSVPLGTNIQPLLYEYLEAGGLTPEDVEIVNLNNADGSNALITGDVQAAVLWDPYLTTVVLNNEGLTQIADTKDFRKFVCPISSSSKYISEHSEDVRKVLVALNKAAIWSKENPDAAAEIVCDYTNSDNQEAIKLAISKSDNSVALTKDKVDNLLLGADVCYKYEIVENEVNLEDYINWDFTDLSE